MNDSQDRDITIDYTLTFKSGERRRFNVALDPKSLDLVAPEVPDPPAWTALDFEQCPNCSLDPASSPRCPVAVNLIDLAEFFKDFKSYDEIEVRVEINERTYLKTTPLQSVASSLMGIYMVTSGCPVLNLMRPMVETHLPFASWQETTYRMMSMYLLAQYFIHKNEGRPKWDMAGLVEYLGEVDKVNQSFFKRLDRIEKREGDTNQNAVSILNSMASIASMSIQEQDLFHWEKIFMATWGA